MGIIPVLTVVLLVLFLLGYIPLQYIFAPILVWLVFFLVCSAINQTYWRRWW